MMKWLTRFRFRALLGTLPIVMFLTVRSVAGAEPAIVAGFSTSAAVYLLNDGRAGAILALSTLALTISAVASAAALWYGNEHLYFAGDAAWDFSMVAISIGSLIRRRPLVELITLEFIPTLRSNIPALHLTFYIATLLAIGVFTVHGITRAWLLITQDSIERYLILSRAMQWSTSLLAILLLAWLIRRAIEDSDGEQQRSEPAAHRDHRGL
jgi:hypothetical protein